MTHVDVPTFLTFCFISPICDHMTCDLTKTSSTSKISQISCKYGKMDKKYAPVL